MSNSGKLPREIALANSPDARVKPRRLVTTAPRPESFRVYRVLEEEQLPNEQRGDYHIITKKVFLGNIDNPTNETFVSWMELEDLYGPGYYLVEIPEAIRRRYVSPGEQRVRTSGYFEPSPLCSAAGTESYALNALLLPW